MHCDQVYAILTRGPFPSGDVTDVAVEIHLAHCIDCRRLAEALRPLPRPHESVSESSHLPGYRGDHPEWRLPESDEHGVAPLLHWQPIARRIPRPLAPLRFGAMLVMALGGIVVGFVISSMTANAPYPGQSTLSIASIGGGSSEEFRDARLQAQLVYGLNLPRACNRLNSNMYLPLSSDDHSPANLTSRPSSFVNQCCTQCHVAGGKTQVGAAQRTKLILSCAICHNETASR